MKEMKYGGKPGLLAKGTIRGYKYRIVSFGSHPCAYVRVPGNHPYYEKGYGLCDISCHGGLTFAGPLPKGHSLFTPRGWWLGWDYAHYQDYTGLFPQIKYPGKKWTVAEIKGEVESVIDQLIQIERAER